MSELRGLDVEVFEAAADTWTEPRMVSRLATHIRRFRPDVVNPHLFRTTLVAAPLAKWLGVPCVVETYHGREAWRHGWMQGSFLVDRLVCRCVDRIIAVSHAARDFLVAQKRIPATKITVIPNGRDLSLFRPGSSREAVRKELGVGSEVPVIGVVGRLEPQKGHRFALDALPEIGGEFPNARLFLIGDGSLRVELERQARALGIARQVVFTGFRSDIPRLLDAMDVVMLPSIHEGLPLVAIEAAAMGKAIVATRVDGTSEVVRDGVTGRLVPSGDAAALTRAVVTLLRHPHEAMAMGQAARENALALFGLERQVAATAQAYADALGRN
jgi:glycosyltransferase involved in cell wall biosynthesis